jgi:hypothetical protein
LDASADQVEQSKVDAEAHSRIGANNLGHVHAGGDRKQREEGIDRSGSAAASV